MKATRKVLASSAGAAGATTLSALASVAPAHADDSYASEAANGLQSKPVYVENSVNLSNANQVSSTLVGSDVGVAVVPEIALGSYTPSDFADIIRNDTGGQYTTILLVVDKPGKDTVAVSSTGNENAIATTVNEALTANNGDAGAAILATASDIRSLSTQTTSTTTTQPSSSDGVGTPTIVGGALGVIIATAAIVAFIFARKNRNKTRALPQKPAADIPTRFSDKIPESLTPYLKQLSDLARKYSALTSNAQTNDAARQRRASAAEGLTEDLKAIINNLQELFTRLKKKGTQGQQNIAEVEYADKLPKLIEALGPNYYLDIIDHETLWDNADDRLREVDEAVKAVEYQLVENIRQVNASKDLEFKVALDSLTGPDKAPNVKDLYNDNPRRRN